MISKVLYGGVNPQSSDYIWIRNAELYIYYIDITSSEIALMRERDSVMSGDDTVWLSKWLNSFEKECQTTLD